MDVSLDEAPTRSASVTSLRRGSSNGKARPDAPARKPSLRAVAPAPDAALKSENERLKQQLQTLETVGVVMAHKWMSGIMSPAPPS